MKVHFIFMAALLAFGVSQVNEKCCEATNDKAKTENIRKEKPKTVNLKITGMTYAGYSDHLSNTMKDVDGIIEQKVECPGELATIQYAPSKTNPDAIIKVIEQTAHKAEIIAAKLSEQ